MINVNFKILAGVVCYALVWAVWDLSTTCMFVAGWAANDLADIGLTILFRKYGTGSEE
jgi:hypothetical protein